MVITINIQEFVLAEKSEKIKFTQASNMPAYYITIKIYFIKTYIIYKLLIYILNLYILSFRLI